MMHAVKMVFERETKGALRYAGTGKDAPKEDSRLIGTLYLRKSGLEKYLMEDGDDWPEEILVTIETGEPSLLAKPEGKLP